jgi:hypothetical protein
LLAVARSIERLIRQQGGTDPLESMPPNLARQVAEDLLSLAVDVQAAFHRARNEETAPVPGALPPAEPAWQPAQA